ncbi:MAG: hypothetical protein K2H98_08280 [Duncaniella sp.]|nr:hypothetical protein [Duncaniella sp.]
MNKLNLLVPFFLVSLLCSFTQADELNNSPYKIFGDNTPVLDASHSKSKSPWSILVALPDSSVASLKLSGDYIILTDSVGNIISTHLIDRSIVASMFRTMDPKAEEMTWISPYAFCAGDPIQFVDNDGKRPTEYEAAMMADLAYIDNLTAEDLPEDLANAGWSISSFNTSIQMNHTYWYENGLQSVLFERTTDGVTEYAYAYAGTASVEDVVEDIFQIIGIAPQYNSAIQNANTLSSEIGDNELTFIGHSLGGGEAAAASMATGREAITFNPAAVSPLTKLFHGLGDASQVTNYRAIPPGTAKIRIGGCFINNLQNNIGMRAPGNTINITLDHHNPYTAHQMKHFVNHFKTKK